MCAWGLGPGWPVHAGLGSWGCWHKVLWVGVGLDTTEASQGSAGRMSKVRVGFS